MRYNADDIAALDEISAWEREERLLEQIRKSTRKKMRAAQARGYKTDVVFEREECASLETESLGEEDLVDRIERTGG
jgi:hypothetical protein